MNKVKLFLTAGFIFALSGCANNEMYHKQPVKSDYEKFCNVEMSEVVPGNYIVNKVDQKYFYITSNGNVYSKAEIDQVKQEQQNIGDQMQGKITGMVNSIIGFNVVPTSKNDNSDVENAKRAVVRKFVSVKNPNLVYCTSILASDDSPEKFTTETYKMTVKSQNYTNVDFYNNSENHHIFLTPLY